MVYHPEESAFFPLGCQKNTAHLKGEHPEPQITDWKTKDWIWNSQVRHIPILLSGYPFFFFVFSPPLHNHVS